MRTWKSWALALALCLLMSPASAQRMMVLGTGGPFSASAPPAYTGPGDIVASATAWYGLRGYSAAFVAPGTGKSVNVRRASDNATQDIVILTTGAVDIASANTFAGPDGGTGVCTGSTAGSSTTLTISVCTASATLHAGDTLTCASCVQPVYISALGTFTGAGAGASGTVTLNIAQNITSQSITSQVALFITKAYDQSGALFCTAAACDLPQATAGNQPPLLPNCQNSLPCISFTTSGQVLQFGSNVTPPNATMSLSVVGNILSGTGRAIFIRFAGSNGNNDIDNAASATWRLLGGQTGNLNVTVTAGTTHAGQGVLNGGTEVINIDGVDTTCVSCVAGNTAANVLAIATGSTGTPAYEMEAGVWGSTLFNGTQRTNVQVNQKAYWNTP